MSSAGTVSYPSGSPCDSTVTESHRRLEAASTKPECHRCIICRTWPRRAKQGWALLHPRWRCALVLLAARSEPQQVSRPWTYRWFRSKDATHDRGGRLRRLGP